jgi:hypothetical protein
VYKVWCQSSKRSRYWAVSTFYVQFDPCPIDIKTHRGYLFFQMYQCTQSLNFVKERLLKILSGQYIPMSSLTLDLKINRGDLLFMMHQCTKFEVHANGSQDIEWSVYSYVQFDPWPINLKINRVHLLFRMYQCIKFIVCQAKGSQDIEQTKYSYFSVHRPWPLTYWRQNQ